jgi:hypothetical protein
MQIRLEFDLKTIIVIFSILFMLVMIFSETPKEIVIKRKIYKEPKKFLFKNPHAIHPMPLPVPKPFAMPFPIQSNVELLDKLKLNI